MTLRPIVKEVIFGPSIFLRRRLLRGRATILYYHRFPAALAAEFRRQCAYLAKHYRVLSMSDLAAGLRERRLPANAAVITIDDGHRDFYRCAFPILREFGFPALMYLPTAFLDGTWLWFDRCQYIFDRSGLQRAEWGGAGLDLASPHARMKSFEQVAHRIQWFAPAERDCAVAELASVLRVRVPERPTEEFAAMTWDEVREVAGQGIEFGGHTVNHPILQTLDSEDALDAEIGGCKRRIEEELQASVVHFAYPSGQADEVSEAAKRMVARAGFETATTTLAGHASQDDDPLWLPRIGCDPSLEWVWFRRGLAGCR